MEYPSDGVVEQTQVSVSTVDSADEHAELWRQIVAAAPGFAEYQVKAGRRIIPLIRLSRTQSPQA